LCPGGSFADIICLYVDGPSASEAGVIPCVSFRGNAIGFNYLLARVHLYDGTRKFEGFFTHTSSDPTNMFASGTLDQCIASGPADGACFDSSGNTLTFKNCCGLQTLGGIGAPFSDNFTALRLIGQHNWSASNIVVLGEQAATPQASWDRC